MYETGARASAAIARVESASRRPASLGQLSVGCVSLAMGEPDAGTHPSVVEAAIDSLRRGNTRYEALTGAPVLREAIAAFLSDDARRDVRPSEVVLTHGGSGGLAATILALVNPGDRVVIPEPTYSLYADQVALAGGIVDWAPLTPSGELDLDLLAGKLPGARMTIICNPGNPTGKVLPPHEVRALFELAQANGCLLLSDEAYCDIVFDDVEFLSVLDLVDVDGLVICSRTFSKSFAMTGWRLGYVIAAEDIAASINLAHRTFNGALNSFVQEAALTALTLPKEVLDSERSSYQQRRDQVIASLGSIPNLRMARPQGAFYAFPRVDSALSSDALTARLAEGGVLVRSGTEYGPSGAGHFRISYAVDPATLGLGLHRIREVLADVPIMKETR